MKANDEFVKMRSDSARRIKRKVDVTAASRGRHSNWAACCWASACVVSGLWRATSLENALLSPSGRRPMSSGFLRSIKNKGTVRKRAKPPRNLYAALQLYPRAMSVTIWIMRAAVTGRAIEVRPRAKLRLRWKKATVAVRGTTPSRMGFAMDLATMYAA